MTNTTTARPLMNPYLAGVLLGLTLLASFLILGTGLGASGGIARLAAFMEWGVAREHTTGSAYFGRYFGGGGTRNPLAYYLVFMFAGVLLGGAISACAGRRVKLMLERGAKASFRLRALLALGGGALAGFASRLGNGCTSGQALSGGALLLSGSLVFMICIFAGGYAAAWFVRRQWDD